MSQDNKNLTACPDISVHDCCFPEADVCDSLGESPEFIQHEYDVSKTERGGKLPRIYMASKTKHASKWRRLRDEGYNIISTWIDEAEPGQTKNIKELSIRCVREIRQADFVVLYCEPGEFLKGALIESGCALAYGLEVRCVGHCDSLNRVFQEHPLWREYSDIYAALEK